MKKDELEVGKCYKTQTVFGNTWFFRFKGFGKLFRAIEIDEGYKFEDGYPRKMMINELVYNGEFIEISEKDFLKLRKAMGMAATIFRALL